MAPKRPAPGSGREKAIAFLKHEIADAFDYDSAPGFISSGSLAVDVITGRGGFPLGRLTEVFGWEASGKTTLCLQSAARAQRDGVFVAYVDAEAGVDLKHAHNSGFITDDDTKGLYLTPNTFEQTVTAVEHLAESGDCPLIIVDSVPGMIPEATFERDIDEMGAIGEQARLLSSTLPRLVKTIAKHKVALVLVNQMRMKINTGWTPPSFRQEDKEQSSGGSALKFFSSLRIDMKVVKKGLVKRAETDFFTGKDIEVAIANSHRARIFKNKTASSYREAEFVIRYDAERGLYGIDNLTTVLGIAVSQGLIKKGGAFYKCELPSGDNFSAQGEDSLFEYVLERPSLAAQLWDEVLKFDGVVTAMREL
jgi:recombination protein RecA